MNAKDDGGPAFPNNDAHGCAFSGMSLRDWFAGMALQGIMNNSNAFSDMGDKDIVDCCYRAADAMLAARKEDA